MEQTSWNRLESLYYTALEIEPNKLDAFLARTKKLNPDIYTELRDLLACTPEAEDLLEEPLLEQTKIWRIVDKALPECSEHSETKTGLGPAKIDEAASERSLKLEPSELVDRYRIVEQIGQGGMGVVYLAAQETPFHREVALKLVYFEKKKISREMVDRFKWECQALASLSHNNIAQVYESGETATGVPYFTMEYIQGLPINEFCDKNQLSARERIRLFFQVNEGVMHAHRKGIIHRDLKPSNILVTLQNEKPVIKIIDFGIARTFRAGTASATAFNSRSPLGTPTYMSPEQTYPGSSDLDVRADIYSLGAILYELLTGFTIINPETFQKALFTEKIKMVRDGEIPRASQRFSSRFPGAGKVALKRKSTPRELVRVIRGDLDAILDKALQKDPEKRYTVVNRFSEDLDRHLKGRPVLARDGGFFYKSGKFLRRNTGLVISASLILMFLAGSLFAIWHNNRILDEKMRQMESLQKWIMAPDPHWQGPGVTYLAILEKVEQNIDEYLVGNPLTDARLRFQLGHLNFNLGSFDKAKVFFTEALSVQEAHLGSDESATLETMTFLAKTLAFRDELQESEYYFQRVNKIKLKKYGPTSVEQMKALSDYALLCNIRGDAKEAERMCNIAIPILIEKKGRNDEETLVALSRLGEALIRQRKYGQAQVIFRDLIEVWENKYGFNYFRTLFAAHNLGEAVLPMDPKEAERIFREVNKGRIETLGEEKLWTLNTQNSLAFALYRQNKLDEAENLARHVLAMREKNLPSHHRETLQTMNNLTLILEASGKLEEALAMLHDLDKVYAEKFETPTLDGLMVKNNIGNVLNSLARYEEAMPVLEETLNKKLELLGPSNTSTLATMVTLGEAYLYAGYLECAEQILREAISIFERHWPDENLTLAVYRGILGECWSRMGDYRSAEKVLLDSWHTLRGTAERRMIGAFIASLYDRWPRSSHRF